jgi:hypothetical protein
MAGVSGAGSLLLVLPVLISGSLQPTFGFLAAFALGSSVRRLIGGGCRLSRVARVLVMRR